MKAWSSTGRLQVSRSSQRRPGSNTARFRRRTKQVPSNEELLGILNDIHPDTATTSNLETQALEVPSETENLESPPTPASQLPQSPLTDPKLNAARFGHKKAKPLPNLQKLSGFQLKLQKNLYGNTSSTARQLHSSRY